MTEIIKYPESKDWNSILRRPELNLRDLYDSVEQIFEDVRMNGDEALRRYAMRFDSAILDSLQVSEEEKAGSLSAVDERLKTAIDTARQNITVFHSARNSEDDRITTSPGISCWQKTLGVEKVGLYIPGGTAPLISTVLMLGIPAVLAGCKEIIICTPPGAEGKVHPAILYTARLLGIERIYKTGGAQAIAAMAYGTESIPRVYKIFGPGNQYVTAAKQLAGRSGVAIDLPAGPSELAVIADESADPVFVAADLLSQAEHGEDSQVMLISLDEELLRRVLEELEEQLEQLPRKEIARKALENSRIILLRTRDEIINLVNEYAPEHLIINTGDYQELQKGIINAGSIFLGDYAPESAGDYASGTNIPGNHRRGIDEYI